MIHAFPTEKKYVDYFIEEVLKKKHPVLHESRLFVSFIEMCIHLDHVETYRIFKAIIESSDEDIEFYLKNEEIFNFLCQRIKRKGGQLNTEAERLKTYEVCLNYL